VVLSISDGTCQHVCDKEYVAEPDPRFTHIGAADTAPFCGFATFLGKATRTPKEMPCYIGQLRDTGYQKNKMTMPHISTPRIVLVRNTVDVILLIDRCLSHS
jgi:hypothetical protein